MSIKLTNLIARVPGDVEEKVKNVRDRSRAVLQEALRTECRLVMKTPEETKENAQGAQVRVEVKPGHPVVLNDLTFPDDFERIMLLGRYRAILEQSWKGAKGLLRLRQEFSSLPNPEQWIQATETELQSTANWAGTLLQCLEKNDPLKTVLNIRVDFLGVYVFDSGALFIDDYLVNPATIHLYWGVIGLVAEWLGCTVEDLTVVVLTHELAHAYTQLGADIDGRRWPAPIFAKAEDGLVEGLAQFYTDRVLRRIDRRYPFALNVFDTMMKFQPEPYLTHISWKDFSPEAVRRAMLEVRRWHEEKLSDFNRRLEKAQWELHPRENNV